MSRFNNLGQRLLTAVVGAAVIIGAIYFNAWAYFAIFCIICVMTQWEFYKLVGLDGMIPLKTWGTFCGFVLFALTFLDSQQLIKPEVYFVLFPLFSFIFFIKLYKKDEKKPFTNIAFTFLGIIYVALPFSLLHFVVFSPGYYSWQILIGCLLLQWSSDVGAYFAGVSFGKTKLFERVSPKKSWEGSIGGTLLALLMAFGLSHFFEDLLLWQWLCIAGIIVIAGTYGDLVESLFKRSIEIKDSGASIPGHGGFLDRFDSLLLSAPFIIAFLKIF